MLILALFVARLDRYRVCSLRASGMERARPAPPMSWISVLGLCGYATVREGSLKLNVAFQLHKARHASSFHSLQLRIT